MECEEGGLEVLRSADFARISHIPPARNRHLPPPQKTEGGYAIIQSTRPQTLAGGLNDSPAGRVSWIAEKFRAWSDCHGDVRTHADMTESCDLPQA